MVGGELSVPSWFDELTIAANGAELRRAAEWLVAGCRQREVPQAQIERLELCLHEALANVITHGGEAAIAATITMRLEVRREPQCSASVTVIDACMAFDPLSVPDRISPKTLAETEPGGLGLVMIRSFSDWLDYRHENGYNHLTFGARWNPS
ncbi:MAG: ATP-binding protein [Betaproteobacteria bacterium]